MSAKSIDYVKVYANSFGIVDIISNTTVVYDLSNRKIGSLIKTVCQLDYLNIKFCYKGNTDDGISKCIMC